MKKFTKLFLSCAAIAALTSTVAVSAMAEKIDFDMKGDVTVKATYDTEAGTLEFAVPSDMAADKAATFVAFPSTANATALKDTDIVGIDQTAAGVGFDKAGLKGKPQATEEKTYTVKLGYFTEGGQFKILEGTLFSAGVLIGDANQDTDITLADATAIVQYSVKGVAFKSDEAQKAADTNQDKDITLADATAIVQYSVKGVDNGHIGQVK